MKYMESKKIDGKDVFAAAVFVATVFILGIKLLNPTPIQIFVGENNTAVTKVPEYFTFNDVFVIIVSSLIVAISGMYLLFSGTVGIVGKHAGKLMLEERKKRWEETAKKLNDIERKIYEVVLESDGISPQSEIVEKVGLPKSNVSRALDLLESKGLVERKRRGMGNIVLLK
jgi:uncharacterized membrane protein